MELATKTRIHRKGTFSLSEIMESVRHNSSFHKAGAITLFIGVVRGQNEEGEEVQRLELEAYEEKANEVLNSICNDLKKRTGIVNVEIHHLLGEYTVGEEIVYALVAASHRKYLFPVMKEAVERYKNEAPIFKKEHVVTAKGGHKASWVEERGN